MKKTPLALFQGTGIELEYIIVDRETLDIKPICDQILIDREGSAVLEMERGPTCWSNELALHIIETKTNGPTSDLAAFADHFQADIRALNGLLEPHGAMLLPTGMHPWMNPRKESLLWPHEQGEIYQQFDRIFNCNGHGWTNLQSMHINLPFANAHEFGQLHRAIRLLLPILPALTASSPVVEGELSGHLDNRLRFYAANCRKVPEVTALVIPEDASDPETYEETILIPLYRAIRPFDRQGILAHEWLNARGAIARFDRDAIEIRVLDTQEFPGADILVANLIKETLQHIINGKWGELDRTGSWETEALAEIYRKVAIHGEQAWISNEDYLGFFDFPGMRSSAGEFWQHLLETAPYEREDTYRELLERGSLATRIRTALGTQKPSREKLREVYAQLACCLKEGRYFIP